MEEKQKASYRVEEEEEDDDDADSILQLLMDYEPTLNNHAESKLITSDEIFVLPDHKNKESEASSSSSSHFPSKGKNNLDMDHEILEKCDEDDFFSKFLNITDNNNDINVSSGIDNNPPSSNVVEVDDDHVTSMAIPPETVVQPPQLPSGAITTRPRGIRKAISPETLAELSIIDPKKAKRIITNRMSAVRAKEKKKLYTCMLEHKLQNLRSESATLNAHLSLLQTEGLSLNAENVRLREQTGMTLQQIHLQDSLNDEIRNEIQHLKTLTQITSNHGIMLNNTGNNHAHNNLAMDAPTGTEQVGQLQVQNVDQQLEQFQQGPVHVNAGQQSPWQVQYDQEVNPQYHLQQEENPPYIEDPNITNPLPYLQGEEDNDH
ncbi:hypothetical protein JCGZ_15044 [Jatropha curcas]|uniref:BZIP domain-containing protein n=2 Tax=Jatropha curcas TaxID=180498 RepID=A0A067LLE6_JATCU|nr:hypothetical protein JCGZ_15044 [Jatropha curcas]